LQNIINGYNLTERETGELKRFVGVVTFKLHKSRFLNSDLQELIGMIGLKA